MKFIDEFEEYPEFYDRISVQVTKPDGQIFDAYVYKMNEISEFLYPIDRYMTGVAKTMATFYYLQGAKRDYENFKIEVIEANTGINHGVYTAKVGIEENAELIQRKIKSICE